MGISKPRIEHGFRLVIITVLWLPYYFTPKPSRNPRTKRAGEISKGFGRMSGVRCIKAPEDYFIDIWLTISVAIIFAVVGGMIEYHTEINVMMIIRIRWLTSTDV